MLTSRRDAPDEARMLFEHAPLPALIVDVEMRTIVEANGALTALHVPLLADMVPKIHAGEFMGFASMVWSVAQPLGALLAGFLADVTGSFRGVFFLAGVCMLVATILLGKVPEKHQIHD